MVHYFWLSPHIFRVLSGSAASSCLSCCTTIYRWCFEYICSCNLWVYSLFKLFSFLIGPSWLVSGKFQRCIVCGSVCICHLFYLTPARLQHTHSLHLLLSFVFVRCQRQRAVSQEQHHTHPVHSRQCGSYPPGETLPILFPNISALFTVHILSFTQELKQSHRPNEARQIWLAEMLLELKLWHKSVNQSVRLVGKRCLTNRASPWANVTC